MEDVGKLMQEIGAKAREAAAELAFAPSDAKRAALLAAAEAVEANVAAILAANEKDLAYGAEKGLSPSMMDRLALDQGRIAPGQGLAAARPLDRRAARSGRAGTGRVGPAQRSAYPARGHTPGRCGCHL